MGIQGVGLEDHGDAALGRGGVERADTLDQQVAGGRLFQTGDDAQQGRLAATGRPDDHDELAVVDVEVDALQDLLCPEAFLQSSEFDLGHASLYFCFNAQFFQKVGGTFWIALRSD